MKMKQASLFVGVATVLAASLGFDAAPYLFQLCTVGVISGPVFVGMALALAALLTGGIRLILTTRTKGRIFIPSAILFGACLVDSPLMLHSPSLAIAAIGSLLGTAFALWRWRGRSRSGSPRSTDDDVIS